jgi:adenylate cyclase
MQERLAELTEKWAKENKDPFRIGVGVNSGVVTVGNLGSEQIFDYTAIGDNMNAGARIEALTRNYETKLNIIISESTYKFAENRLIAEYLDDAKVKGKEIVIPIYELLGLKKEF